MRIRFSFPEFILSVVASPGSSGGAKQGRNCASTVNGTGSTCGKGIRNQLGNDVYTCNT